MTRFSDWPAQLENYLRTYRRTPFEYGVFDCALFTAGAIKAMTGIDLATQFRGKYASADDARKLVQNDLAATVEEVARENAMAEVTPARASRGDMVLVPTPAEGPMLGVVSLNGVDAMIVGPLGWGRAPLSRVVRAWKV